MTEFAKRNMDDHYNDWVETQFGPLDATPQYPNENFEEHERTQKRAYNAGWVPTYVEDVSNSQVAPPADFGEWEKWGLPRPLLSEESQPGRAANKDCWMCNLVDGCVKHIGPVSL